MPRALTVAALALGLSGCSMSMPLGSVWGDRDGREQTGSIGSATASTGSDLTLRAPLDPPASAVATAESGRAALSGADWGYARGALGLALTGPETGPAVPWANPDTGTRGSFAPTAPAITREGVTCRDFVASRFDQGREVQLSGRACRNPAGHWDISDVRTQRASL